MPHTPAHILAPALAPMARQGLRRLGDAAGPWWRSTALLAWWAACATATAQPASLPALRPMSMTSIESTLDRLPGSPATAPRTSSTLDLKGRQVYIAEYLLLFDLSGEIPAAPHDGRLLGTPLPEGQATLAYRARHDIAVLQAITDQAWADLQARLAEAGVALADAASSVNDAGAVHPIGQDASRPDAPVLLQGSRAGATRRYLVLAPTGMRMAARTDAGLGPGDAAARQGLLARRLDGLSLAMAVNFSALDHSGSRSPAFAAPGGLPTLSPLMELAPAPSAALVQAHAQGGQVSLTEVLVPTAAFGRLRLAPLDGPIPSNDPLQPLLSIGRQLAGAKPAAVQRVDSLLDLDGPATARLVLALTNAANQAIVDALKAAR